MKVGVPAVVDTLDSNADQGMTVLSLSGQNQREDVTDDHWVQVGQEMGMAHAMGDTSYFGEYSPYFNLNHQTSTTYGFIIGRGGLLRWKGDLGNQVDEFYLALRAALAVQETPRFEKALPPELEKPVAELIEGDFAKAASESRKVSERFAKKKGPEAEAIAEQAQSLWESLVAIEQDYADRVAEAFEAKEAEALVRTRSRLAAHYPKSAHHKSIKTLLKSLKSQPDFEERVEGWREWLEFEAKRPMTFPARETKDNGRFARRLEKHLASDPNLPGAALGNRWLKRWQE